MFSLRSQRPKVQSILYISLVFILAKIVKGEQKIAKKVFVQKENPASCSRSDEKLYALPLPVLLPFLSPLPQRTCFSQLRPPCVKNDNEGKV